MPITTDIDERTLGAMILAAGRGERMRPLTDHTPKPLLCAGGKPLIVRQIEALRAAGVRRIVINAAHLAARLQDALGTGEAFGVELLWSIEPEPLETAGGIATAFPLLRAPVTLVVSGDIVSDFDYRSLLPRAAQMAQDARGTTPRVHLVMVPNPSYHPDGDFALVDGMVRRDVSPCLTFGNIALYDTSLFADMPRGVKRKLLPLFHRWIDAHSVSGELFRGRWSNVGTPEDLALLDRELAAEGAAAGVTATLQ